MSRKNEKLSPKSLAHHFDPPEGYIGHFGWLCGYSADATFLNKAAERFTTLTFAQRQSQGRIALAIMLNPGNPAISTVDTPAVTHLAIKDFEKKPFCLLHAKFALLGFRHEKGNISHWHLRLIVSTGNWTRQTLEESLDLAWCVDISSADISSAVLANVKKRVNVEKICADIKAANDFLQWVAALFETRLLEVSLDGKDNETKLGKKQFEDWVSECTNKAKNQSRFFDNREKSLLKQLRSKIKSCTNETARAYLAMGSGFYETVSDQSRPPNIPKMIIEELKKSDLTKRPLLTKKPTIDLYVNPKDCQSIATSVGAMKKQGITVRQAAQPPEIFGVHPQRKLHAKFLFSANRRENIYNSAWVYLGSGNLTTPGFTCKMSTSGNFEAGVVFAPRGLLWKEGKKVDNVDKKKVVTNLLPIQWDLDVKSDYGGLEPGDGMATPGEPYIAAPVAWFSWHEEECELRAPDSDKLDFQVLDPTGQPCKKTDSGFSWGDQQPRQVFVRWLIADKSHEAAIPVVDQYGRIAGMKLQSVDLEEAWWQLADFPMPPADDDENNRDGKDENDESAAKGKSKSSVRIPTYPIRRMMELIENIAAKQTEINENDWSLWCKRLDQTLGQAKDNEAVEYFRNLDLNPLNPLRQKSFRPSFAETTKTPAGQMYEDTLTGIEKAWKVDQLRAFGEQL